MAEYLSRLQESLVDQDTFSITWELVPGRGAFEKAQENVVLAAEKAASEGKVHALTMTDNPGGNPAMSPEMLGVEISELIADTIAGMQEVAEEIGLKGINH